VGAGHGRTLPDELFLDDHLWVLSLGGLSRWSPWILSLDRQRTRALL
jgi:hypothetical protein